MNYPKELIAFSGQAGSGKDTAADFLVEEYGFTKIGVSDPIAIGLYTLNPWIYIDRIASNEIWEATNDIVVPGGNWRYQSIIDRIGFTAAKRIPEIRRLAQTFGYDVGRKQIDENIWNKKLEQRILESGNRVVVTGVRFDDEEAKIHELGGSLIRVERNLESTVNSNHATETDISALKTDYLIKNNGSIEHLQMLTFRILSDLRTKKGSN